MINNNRKRAQDCKPNQFSYVTLIHAYAKSNTVMGAIKGEALLKTMYREYQKQELQQQEEQNKIGTSSSQMVSNDSRIMPNTQLITAVIDCWQKSGAPDAGTRAESLLRWMILNSQADDQTSEHKKKQFVLREMKPNAHSFAAAIGAWARMQTIGKATRARKLLVLMEQMYTQGMIDSPPNTYCYTSVINSCAYCIKDEAEKKTSLAIAIKTYKELLNHKNENVQPSHVTFSTFLTALRNLIPANDEKRVQVVRAVFETAKEYGQVDALVLRKLQTILPHDVMETLIPSDCWENGGVVVDRIPDAWKCRVGQ